MKKILPVLAVIFLINIIYFSAGADEGTLKWPEWKQYAPEVHYSDNLRMRFRPIDNYTCEQNPPDFSWWNVSGAVSYDIIVCRDRELTDIVYEKRGHTRSYYNFPYKFEPGIYYWSVRFNTGSAYSVWQSARRFLIEDDAYEFPVEDTSGIVAEAAAMGHPRYYVTKDEISKYRELAKTGDLGKMVKTATDKALKAKTEPDFNTKKAYIYGEGGTALNNLFWKEVYEGHNRLLAATFAYVMNGDAEIGAFAVETLMKMTEFNLPPFDEHTDSYLCVYAMNMAIYYDCLYDLLSSSQRTTVLNKIEEAFNLAEKIFVNNVFYENPQASHEWNCGRYMLVATMLTAGEIAVSSGKADFLLSYYINQTSAHSVEDGGYKGGTGYFRYQNMVSEDFLQRTGVIDMFKKAYFQNILYYHMYMYPAGSLGGYGDDGMWPVNHYSSNIYSQILNANKNPVAKWALEQVGMPATLSVDTFYFDDVSDMEAVSPIHMAKSEYFKDGGFAGLHSDLLDKNRISLLFRSSWYGTYGHSHNDNNGFIIQAYGEPLAIDSGFYPYYQSPHHINYTVKTYAHNTITYNGGKGQPTQDAQAQGKITGFLTHSDFDYVGGDATNAYKEARGGTIPNGLGKVKRHILYVRPDIFIIVDDLAALPNKTASFEFWLQAESDIKVYEDRKGARITQGEAVMDASVHYPEAVVGKYIKGFAGPNLVEYPKEIDFNTANIIDPNARIQSRVYFSTKPVSQTKMVTTLDIHKQDEGIKNISTEQFSDYIKLSFGNGSIAYIKVSDVESVTADGIQFKGVAVLKNEDSIMLVEGTELFVDGTRIFSSNTPISAVLGDDELSLSNIEKDAEIEVLSPGLTAVTEMKKERIREIERGEARNGVTWTTEGDYGKFSLYNGKYHFYLNDKGLPGTPAKSTELTLYVDGVESKIPVKNYYDHDGNIIGDVTLKGIKNIYYVEEMDGIDIYTSKNIISIPDSQTFSTHSLYPSARLRSMSVNDVSLIDDFNKAKEDSVVYVEAENYRSLESVSSVTKESIAVYSFLSGGTLLQNLYQVGDIATYTIDVPKDGVYDLLVNNVVYNSEADADVCVVVGDQTALFTMPLTNGPNGPNIAKGTSIWGVSPLDWHVCRVKAGLELKQGRYDMNLLSLGGGLTKFDWIGLIESDK